MLESNSTILSRKLLFLTCKFSTVQKALSRSLQKVTESKSLVVTEIFCKRLAFPLEMDKLSPLLLSEMLSNKRKEFAKNGERDDIRLLRSGFYRFDM